MSVIRIHFRVYWKELLLAALVSGLYIALVCFISSKNTQADFYTNLVKWDSDWYRCIVEFGYRSTIPPTYQDCAKSNVAFFPLYPIATWFIKQNINISAALALLITAQVFFFLFIFLLFLWMRKQDFSIFEKLLFVFLMLGFPTSYYLICGYSESMFCFGLLAFLLLENNFSYIGGLLLSGTRILGIPVAFSPLSASLFLQFMEKIPFGKWKISKKIFLLTLSGLVGAALFFLYCSIKFGQWNLYFETQRIGWGSHLEIFAPFHWKAYTLLDSKFPIYGTRFNTGHLSYSAIIFNLIFFLLAIGVESALHVLENREFRLRCYFTALFLIYFTIASQFGAHLRGEGVARYSFPIYLVLLLPIFQLLHFSIREKILRKWIFVLFLILIFPVMAYIEYICIRQFTAGFWVS